MRFALIFAVLTQTACLGLADFEARGGGARSQPDAGPGPGGAKELTSFAFLTASNRLPGDVGGVIAGASVSLTVPAGTDVAHLRPTIVHTGVRVSPESGSAQDFSSPVAYTVTAADGSDQGYTVAVTVAAATSKAITRFTILGIDGVISGTNISLTVPFGTDVASLSPTITHTGASVSPASGAAQSFASPVTYTVTAGDGTTQAYTVTVSVAPSAAKAITRFTILGVDGAISGASIVVTLPEGTNITSLTPAIEHSGASVSPSSGAAQDFTNPVVYTVTAADGSTQAYTVTVRVAASSAKAITRFTIQGVDGAIAGSTVIVAMPAGTNVASLAPSIVFTGSGVSPASGAAQSFTGAVPYVVSAADGSTRTYSVYVLVHGTDAIDLSTVSVYNSPADVADWPVTTDLTRIEERPSGATDDGLLFTFPAQSTWPDWLVPGWQGGTLQYTVWPVVNIGGQWCTSGIIQMWMGRPNTGAPLLTDFADNWVYDGRWGPMAGHSPQVGEVMGFFVTAGNARGVTTVTSLRERSNVVLLAVPAGDTGMFDY